MDSSFFQFKQFAVRQRDSAMKIGTDGVLLGAWSKIDPQATNVLDIGTGTGLIALMLAQRFPAILIDAIELNHAAAEEAKFNFSQSPWSTRLKCTAISLQDFSKNASVTFDHIICNPPFYQGAYEIKELARAQARNHTFLPLAALFAGMDQLLSYRGSCSMILPIEYKTMALQEAEKYSFYLDRFTTVRGIKTAPEKRALLAFSRVQKSLESTELTLEISRNQRTQAHQELVDSFYLSKF